MAYYLVRYLDNENGNFIHSDVAPIESYSHFNAIVKFINQNPSTCYKEIQSEKVVLSKTITGIIKRFIVSQFKSKRVENNPLFQYDSIKEIFLEDVINREKEDAADSIESFGIAYPLIVISFTVFGYFLADNVSLIDVLFELFFVWVLATQHFSFKTVAIANLIVTKNVCSLLIALLQIFDVLQKSGIGSWVGSIIWLWASIKTNQQSRIFNSFKQNKKLFSIKPSIIKFVGSIAIFGAIAVSILLLKLYGDHKLNSSIPKYNLPETKINSAVDGIKFDLNNGKTSLISVGKTDVYIPTPEGFVESSKKFPEEFDLRNKTKSLNLVLLYFTEEEYKEKEVNLNSEIRIVCDVKILKSIENKKFNKNSFKALAKELSDYVKLETSNLSKDVNEGSGLENINIDVKSAKVIKETNDRSVIAFDIIVNNKQIYVLTTSILVKDKVINLYISGRSNDSDELQELINLESKWTKQITDAN